MILSNASRTTNFNWIILVLNKILEVFVETNKDIISSAKIAFTFALYTLNILRSFVLMYITASSSCFQPTDVVLLKYVKLMCTKNINIFLVKSFH